MEIQQTIKKRTKAKFLKYISDQEINKSILENNPVPSKVLCGEKLDDYWLEILSKAGKKDDEGTGKFDKHNETTGLPLGTLRSPQKR